MNYNKFITPYEQDKIQLIYNFGDFKWFSEPSED